MRHCARSPTARDESFEKDHLGTVNCDRLILDEVENESESEYQ
jgi:hypothetical protein